MPHRIITPPGLSKLSSLPLICKNSSLPSLAQCLLTALDVTAPQDDWRISSTHHSFGRAHHISRFARLTHSSECWECSIVSESPSRPPRRLA